MRGEIIKFDCVSCFPLHFFSFRALPLSACFKTEHSTVEAFLFVKWFGYEITLFSVMPWLCDVVLSQFEQTGVILR